MTSIALVILLFGVWALTVLAYLVAPGLGALVFVTGTVGAVVLVGVRADSARRAMERRERLRAAAARRGPR